MAASISALVDFGHRRKSSGIKCKPGTAKTFARFFSSDNLLDAFFRCSLTCFRNKVRRFDQPVSTLFDINLPWYILSSSNR